MGELSIQEAAEQIRHELPDLVGDAADQMDTAISAALRVGNEDVLFSALISHEKTRARLDELLKTELDTGERGFSSLPGHSPKPVDALIYKCPKGDYEWPAFAAGEPVSECPTHHIALLAEY